MPLPVFRQVSYSGRLSTQQLCIIVKTEIPLREAFRLDKTCNYSAGGPRNRSQQDGIQLDIFNGRCAVWWAARSVYKGQATCRVSGGL